MDKDNYDIFKEKLLMDIFDQIPNKSILAIDVPTDGDFLGSSTFKLLQNYQIYDSFVGDCINPSYYFLVKNEYLHIYKYAIASELPAYLCNYMIYSSNMFEHEIFVTVYDGCIFNLSRKIIIDDDLISNCEIEGIYINKMDFILS